MNKVNELAKILGYTVLAIIVFYAVMFFFAESLPLPYRSMPDAMKIERMIAAEAIECAIGSDPNAGAGMFLLGVSKSDLAKLAVDSLTRDQLLEQRDDTCQD